MPSLDYDAVTWAALAYLSVTPTALPYLLYYRVLAVAGSGNLLLVTLMVAPVAIALGALVLAKTCARRLMRVSCFWLLVCWCWTGACLRGCRVKADFPYQAAPPTVTNCKE